MWAVWVARFWLALAPFAAVAGRPPAADREIAALLETLQSAGCMFVRGGTEYDGKRAREHLQMKLNRAGDRVQTVESFIKDIASQSYTSGDPYLVRCPGHAATTAGGWLTARLAEMRAKAATEQFGSGWAWLVGPDSGWMRGSHRREGNAEDESLLSSARCRTEPAPTGSDSGSP